jgi:hypothetical protein
MILQAEIQISSLGTPEACGTLSSLATHRLLITVGLVDLFVFLFEVYMALVTDGIGKKTRARLAKRPGGNKWGCAYRLVQDLYIIQINGFSTFKESPCKTRFV